MALGVAGCGLYGFEQRAAWRNEAEQACLAQKLVQPTAYMSRMSSIDGPGACGMNYPFKIAAFAGGSVGLTSQVTLACPIVPRIDSWLNEVVQPAASLYFASNVVEVRSGSYSCRSRNGQRGARLSEHAFGNALDVMAFRFADGRELAIAQGWRGSSEEQDFLREVFVGACNYFTTVLGPGSDAFHYDHFHLDLARHDVRGERHVCKPAINFTPRLDPGTTGQGGIGGSPRRDWRPIEPSPEDMEADDDLSVVSSTVSRTKAYSSADSAEVPSGAPRQTYTQAPSASLGALQRQEPIVPPPQLWTRQSIY